MITEDKQEELFIKFKTPPHVIAHCNEVARVAVCIAGELNRCGYDLDIDLLKGAASVHDLVRPMEDHDIRGAEILENEGYPAEAGLVRRHMKYREFNSIENLDEQDILCLADRLVKEDRYVGLQERMDYLIAKPICTPEMAERIRKAQKITQELIDQIEKTIGMSLMVCVSEKSAAAGAVSDDRAAADDNVAIVQNN